MRRMILLSLLFTAGAASAQSYYERAQTWEFGLNMQHVEGWESLGPGGSGLDFEGETGWGISGGYNFSNRLAIQFEYANQQPKYRATYVPEDGGPAETLSHRASLDTFHVKGTLYILPGPLTPFVEAGAGWTRVDSNVASGPPITGCWWDPWWWYRCSLFYQTYGATEASFTGSVGVRWDITESLFLRADYGMVVLQGSGARDMERPNMGRATFGWRF